MDALIKAKTSKAVSQYLSNYAEKESLQDNNIKKNYDYVIVIPICNESIDCLQTIFSKIDNNVLIIVVVNSSIANDKWQVSNERFIEHLKSNSKDMIDLSNHCQLLGFTHFNDVLLVDRNSSGQQIHSDYGVGLARKIGCDLALNYFMQGIITHPWIFSTDADVTLPQNYFTHPVINSDKFSAIVLEFEHFSNDIRLNQLQFYYDFKLYYYYAGIKYADTHYDYIPLGSTLIVNMIAYAQVRGFPKKNAGEDFYLLNKLAKIKPIHYVHDVVVKIQSRLSNRVPFGTGPALIKINNLNSVDDYKYYSPKCFLYLKKWQKYLDSLYQDESLKIKPPEDLILQKLYQFFDCQKLFEKSVQQIANRQRWSQFIVQWFDAFRTLKAVHYFNKIFPQENYKQLLKSDNFVKVANPSLQRFMQKNDKN